MTLTLVHLGSWGNDPGRPRQERIGELTVRDIAYYGTNSFERVLDREQPDAVIFLSTLTFAHRAFIRYCNQRSIPTLHVYHGLENVTVSDDRTGSYKIARLAYAKFVFSKLGKLFRHTFPCYVASLIRTKAKPKDWIRFISDIIRMAVGNTYLPHTAADDAKTTKCAVYTNADIEHAVRVYGFKQEDVLAVGNPDLERFGVTESILGCRLQRPILDLEAIMYIETGFAGLGLYFASPEAFIDHLRNTAQALDAQGKKMFFKPKPHPGRYVEFLQKNLDGSGVEFVSNEDFLAKLQECAACIVEPTTLAVVPALMGVPLLYAHYNELDQVKFGPGLTSYPRGYILHSVSDVSDILRKDSEEFDSKVLSDWIAVNAGPLPAAAMPDRVANVVLELINQNYELARNNERRDSA